MKYRTRIYYNEKQKALMWDRWQEGDSLHEIARLFNDTIRRFAASLNGAAVCVHRLADARHAH